MGRRRKTLEDKGGWEEREGRGLYSGGNPLVISWKDPRWGGGTQSPWPVAVTTPAFSFPAHLPTPPRPALCNRRAARACLASSSCLDQSCRRSAVSQRPAVATALGWGWSCSRHNTGISPRAGGGGFPGFCVYMALTQGDTQMPQEQAAGTHRRPADREEGK